ncbi:non-canonical purine NTP pyrophosphatase [Campylobacter geochelonis]|uniref:non-canonical purine NTP pyrophosphatase n=1 Tax=Campylobacter geochelonis TaxID=1780362 RepID=UPI0007708583|nr:non-canonical purine NTP pyrophosphatase [Campylobacter geochelonis]CZE49874.1 putative deoxyribonucleotide triphosphate pyrophosphatase [Campylobacter geochelonis]
MKIVLATSNKDKVKEIKEFFEEYEIYALSEIMQPFEIIEDGTTFQENALIKARAVFAKLSDEQKGEFIALSDDSGISVDALDGAPGIYSARFSSDIVLHPTDESNRAKLTCELRKRNLTQSKAHYTAAIAVASKFGEFVECGYMHGVAIDKERGKNGFGYDFMFIPDGFDKTVGELDLATKLAISHRSNGLRAIKPVLEMLKEKFKG